MRAKTVVIAFIVLVILLLLFIALRKQTFSEEAVPASNSSGAQEASDASAEDLTQDHLDEALADLDKVAFDVPA
ncbi:MAG: hypothetical protein FJZ58_04870 [Chlamydiae bacterium]|nr:hypothetical protein [Chlamydiota bacterium]